MHIELSTDHNIEGKERLGSYVEEVVKQAVAHFSEHITRVEVHLSDEVSKKAAGQGEKRCMMEARLEGRKPIAVNDHSATLDQAISGAAKKLATSIETVLGRLHDAR